MSDPALEESFRQAAAALRSARSVVVASHVDPDGDAMGSSLGLSHALDRAGIQHELVSASGTSVPSTYDFLPGADRIRSVAGLRAPDVFVALDSPDTSRLGDAAALAREAGTYIVIDHHPDASLEGDIRIVDDSACATGGLIWRLLPALGVRPDATIATCLYTAVLTDTGRFSYSNTTPAALRLAADMVDAGAHPNDIYAAVYESRSAGAQLLVGRTLSRVTVVNGGAVAYSWVNDADYAETGALPEEGENLIDFVRSLGGVDVVLLAKLNGGAVRGSLRAKTSFDVGEIARRFGGGGHRAAAGFSYQGDLDALLAEMLPLLPGGGR